MKLSYRFLPAVIALSLNVVTVPSVLAQSPSPPLVLAEHYYDEVDLSRYWVSEKFDGARAWWDGENIISRGGGVYNAPEWFTAGLPKQVLDGELWIGRGQFQALMQTIRDQVPDDAAWGRVKFLVFDAPEATGNFSERQQYLSRLLSTEPVSWVEPVAQTRVFSRADLHVLLERVTNQGGEGLMLQYDGMTYQSGRHHGLLKLKLHNDAEARVLAHLPGKGKYLTMMGSILVEDNAGVQFKIGTGFTDDERKSPPPIGSFITYRYQGKTTSSKPRFARFLRIRAE